MPPILSDMKIVLGTSIGNEYILSMIFFLIHFIVYLYMHYGWRSSYKEEQDWDYISRFIPRYMCVPVSSQDLAQWSKVKG
jgi:hypothetical protein